MGQDKQEVCSIRIMFPVTSDEQAIEYKRKIVVLLSEIPEAQMHFALMPSIPTSKQVSNPIR